MKKVDFNKLQAGDLVKVPRTQFAPMRSGWNAKTGETTGKGVFTIVEVKAGQGASAGWGRLKSGAGWISLDYATRLA